MWLLSMFGAHGCNAIVMPVDWYLHCGLPLHAPSIDNRYLEHVHLGPSIQRLINILAHV